MSYDRVTAIHEAGHTIFRLHFGFKIAYTTVIPEGGQLGLTSAILPRSHNARILEDENRMQEFMTVLAGGLAEEIAFGIRPRNDEGDNTVLRLLRTVAIEPKEAKRIEAEAVVAARQLLKDKWSDIERLADALVQGGRLTGDKIEELLRASRAS